MAELFSLMPEATSCKGDRVEATHSLCRSILPASLLPDAFMTGEISRDARSASLCARREAGSRFALEMTLETCLVSFRARAADAYRAVLTTMSGRHREESRPRHLRTFPMECAEPSWSVEAAGSSAFCLFSGTGFSLWPFLSIMVQKSMTEKAARRNPLS